ncbi:MAG TPA: hypothetical protein VFV73_31225 [Streptosporangiaceae bacterium]|nr:hypothetical protein [Streptosporangiaceae bacterium]
MSRYRLVLTSAKETALRDHCAHARFVRNLCVEQEAEWRPGRGKMPGFAGRCRQLSEARADNPWLAAGSSIVQQQAIRDHDQAMRNFFAGTHGRPTWRKAGRDEGFRIVAVRPGDVRRLNRKTMRSRVRVLGVWRTPWWRENVRGWPVSRGWGLLPRRGAAGSRVVRLCCAGAGAVARWAWPSAGIALAWRSRPRARA